MNKFLLIDISNLFWRGRHVTRGTLDERCGLCLDIIMSSISKCWKDFQPNHLVVALDGRSWRKDFYAPYKANRKIAREKLSLADQQENEAFYKTFDGLLEYLQKHTNCTILQNDVLEADDLLAGFLQAHPNDEHIIVSSDTDFVQLLAPNVSQFNGITKEMITIQGIFDIKNKPVIDKKTKLPKTIPDPEWLLFEKCMRGDPTDNVFSAYPGVRGKSTKKKIGLIEAFAGRNKQGYAYNNLMLQRWSDHNGVEHRVLDDYHRNVTLVDLCKQPDNIRKIINNTIAAASVSKSTPQIGTNFLKFCGKNELITLSQNAQLFAVILGAPYPEHNSMERIA